MSLLDVNFDVNQVIKDAEAALGKYGPVIWDAAYRQVYVNALIDLVWLVAWGIATVVAFQFARHFFKAAWVEKRESFDDHEGEWCMTAVFVVAALIFAALAVSSVTAALNNLLNPTWAALQLLKP